MRETVVVGDADGVPGATPWAGTVADPATTASVSVPFDPPLWVLFSSGTTGLPNGIVHGHGGILLEHLKFLGLHNLRPGDRFFWQSSTSWMVWNVLVSGLLTGATVVRYE